MTDLQFFLVLYLAVGTALAIASSRRLTPFDNAMVMVFFWPFFSITALVKILLTGVFNLGKAVVHIFRKKS